MPPYRATVVGPTALVRVFRLVALAALIPTVLFSFACGGSSTPVTTVGPGPTFTSIAPQIAQEGVQYSYDIVTTTTDGSTVTYKVASGPSGATITGSALNWTPTHAESRIANSISITATTSTNGTATQTFTVTPTGNIDGMAIDHAIAGGALVDYPQNLSAVTIEVLLPNNKGGYLHIHGTGDSSGNFTVPNIPAGSFLLHLPRTDNGVLTDNYIWSDASDIDAGQLLIGRPGAVHASSGVTIHPNGITLSVSPKSGDSIRWTSPDANASGTPSGTPSTPYSSTFLQSGGLIDSAKGDNGYLLHYTTSGLITSEVESETFSSLTETNGGTVDLTGSMTANSGSTTDPNVKITTFDAVNSAIPGFGGTTLKNFAMFDSGYAGTEGFLPSNLSAPMGAAPIVLINIPLASISTDTDFGSISYGVVTTKGVPFVQLVDLGSRSFTIGSSNYTFENEGQVTITNVISTSSAPVASLLSEPLNPTVDGKSFFSNQGSISTAPQVSWGTPILGTPTAYELTVVNPATLGSATPDTHYFYTFANGVSIPSGVLHANTPYVFILQAMLFQSNAFKTAPFRLGTNAAWTSEVSGVMTPSTGASTVRSQASASAVRRQVHVQAGAYGRLEISVKK
jgi:hypothetical protein